MSFVERHARSAKAAARSPTLLIAVAAALLVGVAGRVADLVFFHNGPVVVGAVERGIGEMQDRVEPIILVGGFLIERTRHMIAGGALGCAAGAGAALTIAGGAAVLTGGAAALAMPTAASIGCGLGAPIGAAFGYPLDRYNWDLDLSDAELE